MARILVIDDEPALRAIMVEVLRGEGHDVVEAATGAAVSDTALLDTLDLVVTDLIMPDVEGMEVVSRVSEHRPDLPVLAISGGGRGVVTDYLPAAQHLGARAILRKPFTPDALVAQVAALLEG